MALAMDRVRAIERLRSAYTEASDDPVVRRMLMSDGLIPNEFAAKKDPTFDTVASPSLTDAEYSKERRDSEQNRCISPVDYVNWDRIQSLYKEHYPQDEWPLLPEQEAYLRHYTGAQQSSDEDFRGDGRKLDYTATKYGPYRASRIGYRVDHVGSERDSQSKSEHRDLLRSKNDSRAYSERESWTKPLDKESPWSEHDSQSKSERNSQSRPPHKDLASGAWIGNENDASIDSDDEELAQTLVMTKFDDISAIDHHRPEQDAVLGRGTSSVASTSLFPMLSIHALNSNKTVTEFELEASHSSPLQTQGPPGQFPFDSKDSHASSVGFSPSSSSGQSSLVSRSDETLAGETLHPYIPGSYVVPAVHDTDLLSSKRTHRPSKTSASSSRLTSPSRSELRLRLNRSPVREERESFTFQRRQFSMPPTSSLLSSRLLRSDTNLNHFQQMLARYSQGGIGELSSQAFSVSLYFPEEPQNKTSPLQVHVRSDITMEELIGYGLFCFLRQYQHLPYHKGHHDRNQDTDTLLETSAWALYMVEDGLVDEDYPAIDRSLIVGRFGEHEFALCAQIPNRNKQPPARSEAAPLAEYPSVFAKPLFETISLQIMVVPHAKGSISVNVPQNLTAKQVIATVCKQCQLGEAHFYALLRRDDHQVIPWEQLVSRFWDRKDLVLVDQASLPRASQSTAMHTRGGSSIPEQPKYTTAMDLISNYKAYNVSRRHPISVGRHERVLTIDGDWIHIIRPAEKRVSHPRSTSYPISAVIRCELYSRMPNVLKLIVKRDANRDVNRDTKRDTKRYDFHAESRSMAKEIVTEINKLRPLS
ncbi:Component of a membrane-bound complex containing the Tor2p kinase [Malassezia psittaci]|uniref:Component of a membrane-bound complex containing the Tor2p kinase n=1 Tax=Malassezia psittaci TaxID=1821823 RepID=A0AAF0FG25_9BASI|nr:Component of a membrane-bound complex containing the Tor2p kinase [Malassezia psittaci]